MKVLTVRVAAPLGAAEPEGELGAVPDAAGAPVKNCAPLTAGPGPTDAEAPWPTREPSPCYIRQNIIRVRAKTVRWEEGPTPEGPWKACAVALYLSKVRLPVGGALIAPTMPVMRKINKHQAKLEMQYRC